VTPFLLVTDLDNTLVGDDEALAELNRHLTWHREEFATKLVYSTGRSLASYQHLCTQHPLLIPDALVTGVGTAIYYEASGEPDPIWSARLAPGWNRDRIATIAAHFSDLVPQPDIEQSAFKVSYYLGETVADSVLPAIKSALQSEGLQGTVIYSGGKDLDILPFAADKGLAMDFLRSGWQFPPEQTVACGDSGNDIALFKMGDERGIIVGNARSELVKWHHANPSPHHYYAKACCAGGILEGLNYFNFLAYP